MTDELKDIRQLPPQSLEAERALLGACLLSKEAVSAVQEYVQADDFYGENHRLIFRCLCQLSEQGIPVDLVTVVDALQNSGDLAQVGGVSYISNLTDAVPSAGAAVHYARIVAEKALSRSLIAAASLITKEGYVGAYQPTELLEMAEKSIFDISQGRRRGYFQSLSELLPIVFEMMAKIKAADGITGVPTFRDLDKLLSGLQKSDLVILAARPAVGKTSMAINIAQNAAVRHGMTAAVFSLEMPKEQLVQRMLCTEAKVNQGNVRKGLASAEDFGRLSRALTTMSKAEIYIDDSMNITVGEMRSKLRKLLTERKRLDLVVIDYIQLMQGGKNSGRTDNRQLEVAEISRGLKAMAKELEVPVLALSQLSRLADRANEPPSLSHLRESGALEQDADVVMLLHKTKNEQVGEDDEPVDMGNSGEVVTVSVAKHRNGPTGDVELLFLKDYTSFQNLVQKWNQGEQSPPEVEPPF
ncbi:MAG: replicative DNA helicase [Clostridiales bacterium]